MKKDNDFGLREIDLKKRKINRNKKPVILFLIIIVSVGICFQYFNDIDKLNSITSYELSNNKNYIIDSLKSKNLYSKNIQLSDTLNSQKEIDSLSIDSINLSIKFNKEIIEIDSLTGNYFIIEGSFSNYNLSLNRAKYLLNSGYQPIIIIPKNNNMYRVAVDMYVDLEDARESLEAYKNKLNNKLWILRY